MEVVVTRQLIGEFALGLALALLAYNCAWTFRHSPRTARRRDVLFALVFSLLPVVGLLSVFIHDQGAPNPARPMNTLYFTLLLIVTTLSLLWYGLGLHMVLKRAVLRRRLRT